MHGPRHITRRGRSVFHDLFPESEADQLAIRAELLIAIARWLAKADTKPAAVAALLKIIHRQLREIRDARIDRFTLDQLVRWASLAGLRPRIELAA